MEQIAHSPKLALSAVTDESAIDREQIEQIDRKEAERMMS